MSISAPNQNRVTDTKICRSKHMESDTDSGTDFHT